MSTSHTLLELVEEINPSLNETKYTFNVFTDLKKAFDPVNLIEKLNFYGVRGVAEKLA